MESSNKIIESSFWLNADTGLLILKKDWDQEEPPPICLHSEYGNKPVDPLPIDKIVQAELTGYYTEEEQINFIFDANTLPHFNWEKRKIYVAGDFNGWDQAVGNEKWELKPETEVSGKKVLRLRVPRALCLSHGEVLFKYISDDHFWIEIPDHAPNRVEDDKGNTNYRLTKQQSDNYMFTFAIEDYRALTKKYTVQWENDDCNDESPVVPGYSFTQISSHYDMGVHFRKGYTVFRLFAPRATEVTLEIFKDLETQKTRQLKMEMIDDCTWQSHCLGDLHGTYYHYRVDGVNLDDTTHFDKNFKIVDPYAKATMGPLGPGVIINEDRFPKFKKVDFDPPAIEDMVIMEAHVRDLTTFAPIGLSESERKGFKGLTKWLESEESYLKKMGVNTLELQPIQQFDSSTADEYHWGYMTNNYFAPCCHYGTEPEKASQILEFRELVEMAHKKGLAILIDVVYNHVGEPPHLLYLDKKYYFDLAKDGSLMNWSGCGNTLRADTPMGRKLIIESLTHLMEFYGVDGFRFDLAELLGIAVLAEIETELKKVNPKVILIAEPWSFRGNIARDLKKTGYSFWNDGYREFMVKYLRGKGNQEGIIYYLKGSLDDASAWPGQSINYVESHDDRCWIDKITENPNYRGDSPTHNDRIRTQIMLATLMCSIGTPMISAGQDYLRSKEGINNTYQNGNINALNYHKIKDQSHTHNYFKKWIAFRQSPLGKYFRLTHRPSSNYTVHYTTHDYSSVAEIINVDFSTGNERLLFAVNPHDTKMCIYMHGVCAQHWKQLAHQDHFSDEGFDDGWIRQEGEGALLSLPKLSCGLWVQEKQPHW